MVSLVFLLQFQTFYKASYVVLLVNIMKEGCKIRNFN